MNEKQRNMENLEKTPFIQQKIKEIRAKLAKPCTEFQVGGFRPMGKRTESWIGRVFLCKPNEKQPVLDKNGNELYPLAQFYLPNLPFIPEQLKHITWLTVFIGNDLPDIEKEYVSVDDENSELLCSMKLNLSNNGEGWLIREYTAKDELVEYEFERQGFPKPFPLKANYIAEDYPMWDGGGIPWEIASEINSLEPSYPNEPNENQLDYHTDIAISHSYTHKFGGYPSFCQPGIDFTNDEESEFMFQISSDEKAKFNVVDSGSLMFARNSEGKWKMYYDFY